MASVPNPEIDARRQAHWLLDALPNEKISAVRSLLEVMVDPVSRAIANAPFEDESISDEETRAVAASKAWMAEHPGQGIPFEELLSEFGVTAEELRHGQDAA